MKITGAFVLAIILVVADAKVVPASNVETQQTANQPIQLSDVIDQARASITSLTTQIQQNLNLPEQDVVVNTFKEQSQNFATSIQSLVTNITQQMHEKSPELENAWNNMKATVNRAVENINAEIPNAREQLSQLQAKFEEGVQTIVKESDKAAKALSNNSEKVQEDIAKYTKQAIDIAVQATQNLNNQLQQAAAPKS